MAQIWTSPVDSFRKKNGKIPLKFFLRFSFHRTNHSVVTNSSGNFIKKCHQSIEKGSRLGDERIPKPINKSQKFRPLSQPDGPTQHLHRIDASKLAIHSKWSAKGKSAKIFKENMCVHEMKETKRMNTKWTLLMMWVRLHSDGCSPKPNEIHRKTLYLIHAKSVSFFLETLANPLLWSGSHCFPFSLTLHHHFTLPHYPSISHSSPKPIFPLSLLVQIFFTGPTVVSVDCDGILVGCVWTHIERSTATPLKMTQYINSMPILWRWRWWRRQWRQTIWDGKCFLGLYHFVTGISR